MDNGDKYASCTPPLSIETRKFVWYNSHVNSPSEIEPRFILTEEYRER